jgi:hypothetical protein
VSGLAAWTRRHIVPLALCLGSGLVALPVVHAGWIATDEGVLAHSAQRVLQGDLPQRDFDDVYTGGLAMLDAGVFRVLGTRLIALRLPLVIAFALWTLAVYAVARRFTSTPGAALVTVLADVWTIPCYPAAMPSWYTLFLFTAGTAALCVYVERRRPIWLVVAGLAGGMAITIKITGLYYVAAALLVFVFLERQDEATAEVPTRASDRVYAVVVTALLLAFVAALVLVVRQMVGLFGPLLHFVSPSAALVAVLLVLEWRGPAARPWTTRMARLASFVGPFLLGVAVPIAVFLVPYLVAGAMRPLAYGVFVLPRKRFDFVTLPPGSLRTVAWAIPWFVVLTMPAWRPRWYRTAAVGLPLLVALIPIVIDGGIGYRTLWRIFNHLDWTVVLIGAWLVESLPDVPPVRRAQLWLLLCMSALASLVRFPYAGSYYILYFAPLAMLAILGVVTTRRGGAGQLPALVGAFLLVVGVTCAATRRFSIWGTPATPVWAYVPLAGTGITVPPADRDTYDRAVALVQAHTAPDAYTYAGPDLPQIYFLSQRRDPARTLYDFFDDATTYDADVLRAIDAHHVTAVTINTAATFSPAMGAKLRAALRDRFPDSAVAGPFIIRWRGSPAPSAERTP